MLNLNRIIDLQLDIYGKLLTKFQGMANSYSEYDDATLRLETKRGRTYHYIYYRGSGGKKGTRRAASPEQVRILQDRAYAAAYANELEKLCANLSLISNKANLPTPAEINALLRPAYRSSARTRTTNKTDEERAWLMQMEAFKRKHPSSLDAPTIKVYDNVFTRTRAEAFCMLLLDKYNITYIYECPIFANGKYRYPDFTLLINGKVFLWEHLGLIYDKDYYDKQLPKFNDYATIGYNIGSNLFLSFDGPDGDFDCVALENTLLSIINIAYM